MTAPPTNAQIVHNFMLAVMKARSSVRESLQAGSGGNEGWTGTMNFKAVFDGELSSVEVTDEQPQEYRDLGNGDPPCSVYKNFGDAQRAVLGYLDRQLMGLRNARRMTARQRKADLR